jgi:hypothetical protein
VCKDFGIRNEASLQKGSRFDNSVLG